MLCLNVSNTFSYNTVDNTFTVYLVSHIYIYMYFMAQYVCFLVFQRGRLQRQKDHPNQHGSQLRIKDITWFLGLCKG